MKTVKDINMKKPVQIQGSNSNFKITGEEIDVPSLDYISKDTEEKIEIFHNIKIHNSLFPQKEGNIMSNKSIITVADLKKHYGNIKAVDGVSFEVNSGTIFSCLGPNGAGKTTTVEMMEGLRTPTSGSIKILGVDVTRDYASIRHRVGVLPQDFIPFER